MSDITVDEKLTVLVGSPRINNSMIDKRVEEYNNEVSEDRKYREKLQDLLKQTSNEPDENKSLKFNDKLGELLDDYNNEQKSNEDFLKEFPCETK